jgi:hypothetical protein
MNKTTTKSKKATKTKKIPKKTKNKEEKSIVCKPPSEQVKETVEEKEPVLGSAKIIFNHYNQSFPIKDGVLDGNVVDDKYCFSFAYKGNFQLELRHSETQELIPQPSRFLFQGLKDGDTYHIQVIPDPTLVTERKAGGIQFNKTPTTKKPVDHITEELKKMTVDQLMEKGERYQQLIEAREIESCLYA